MRIYGETSYENQMAVMSHYLHNHGQETSEEERGEIIAAVREFLERKQFREGKDESLLAQSDLQSGCIEYKDFQSDFRIKNAYTRGGRIANPTERHAPHPHRLLQGPRML